jgi:alkanesulfonate monooxygenase SsuD/methylene tetrahydromethanopterin reductase-like flavin-dependent oxidoreductase (luciferase family)
MRKLKLSLLELGDRNNQNSLATINDILTYSVKADELNFRRIWLGEHHSFNSLHPYTNPEILMTLIAGNTNNIRVGSGGALIGYHSPYLLASNYKLLNNIFEDRIDFGLSKGRPSNSDKHDYFRLKPESHFNLFSSNLESICELFYNEVQNYEEREIVIPPYSGKIPSLWYLSNGYKDLDMAIAKKLNYCRSLIHGLNTLNVNYEKEKIIDYKERFNDQNGYLPQVALALGITFSKTKEEVEKTEALAVNKQEAFKIIPVTIDSLFDLLHEYEELYGIDEFIIYDSELNNDIKINNLQEISEKFCL